MNELTPKNIVEYLDTYIVGQKEAKRAVAVALRNRWRSSLLPKDISKEISPKNILMMGPTGVGKTEIARRIATLTKAPFIKVEATKYTEVGYVGRDVESMVRDLAEEAVRLVKKEESAVHGKEAEDIAAERIAEIMYPSKKQETRTPMDIIFSEKKENNISAAPGEEERRKQLTERIKNGDLDDRQIEIEVEEKGKAESLNDNEQANQVFQMLSSMMPKKKKKKKMTVRAAKKILTETLAEEMTDTDAVREKAIALAEERGIIFIDEIDKIAGRSNSSGGPDVSREGVQRDILPIVEGATVKTKYGQIKTDHILFMAAGAFHVSKPSDLIPELQGRFPIRVELQSLSQEDLRKILTEPRQALIRQYKALLETEDVEITFTEDALDKIADIASTVNRETEDIGARRLYTVLEKVLEDLSFEASDLENKKIVIDENYVKEKLGRITENIDISHYIL